ncbi:MAG TPA: GNAT family N-acetyltransferase [Anaerolineales bacterium]|nr:GNAT family N-acetyltransferase [Anaerolineales bacterium]
MKNSILTRALPEHAESLTEITLAGKRHWNYPERWIELWRPSLNISADYISAHETWMCVLNGRPIAYYSLSENEEGLWLDNLWVLPEYIGKGLGRQLFEHARVQSRLRGASVLNIEADPNAEAFYQHMGAQRVGEHQYELEGQPRMLPVLTYKLS